MQRLFLFILVLPLYTNAQFLKDGKKSIFINQDFHDYGIKVLDGKLTNLDSSLSHSFRLGLIHTFSPTFGVQFGLSNGFLLNQSKDQALLYRKGYFFGANILLNINSNNGHIFKKTAPIYPSLIFGYNWNYIKKMKTLDLNPWINGLNYGIGLNFKSGPKSNLNYGIILNQQLSGDFTTHIIHRFGYSRIIDLTGESGSTDPIKTPNDYDNDGVADINDQCPTLKGISKNKGCPEGYVDSKAYTDLLFDTLKIAIFNLETKIQSLKFEIENLKQNEAKKPKSPDVVKPTKPSVPQTPSTTKKDTIAAQSNNTKEPEIKDGFEIIRDKTYTYYVIGISALNYDIAKKVADKLKKEYPVVKIIAQPNGFYRTGIYATNNKEEALKILEYAKTHGIVDAWIAYY